MRKRIKNAFLKCVFQSKKNFVPGCAPQSRDFDGVEITPFLKGLPAAATISADFELSWAWRGWRSAEETRLRAARERWNVVYLIRLLEEYAIPITWATVGHLFLERCERCGDGRAHPQMPRPVMRIPQAIARWTGDWYLHDPCTDYRSDPLWYCPDLIQLIRSSRVQHELGSHSFSHISFLPDNSTPELVEQEIAQCQSAMSPFGLLARSLVYPYNHMGHHYAPLLTELGITCVRHRDPVVRLSYPERLRCGMYKLYESMNLRRPRGYSYIDKVRIFLDEAMKRQGAYHLWFHPSDPTELFENEFHEIIHEIAARRRTGQLWVTTMAKLTAYCEARLRTELEVRRHGTDLSIMLRSDYQAKRYGDTRLTLRIPSGVPPIRCLAQTRNRWEPVKWKHADPRGGKREPRSFLVDVPANARQLLVSFPTSHASKTEQTAAITSSAFA